MKAVVAAFNQEKALVGAFSVITNLLFQALLHTEIEIEISFELVKILYNCTLQIFLDFEPHLIIQRGIEKFSANLF